MQVFIIGGTRGLVRVLYEYLLTVGDDIPLRDVDDLSTCPYAVRVLYLRTRYTSLQHDTRCRTAHYKITKHSQAETTAGTMFPYIFASLGLSCAALFVAGASENVPSTGRTCAALEEFYSCSNHSASIMPTWCSAGNPFIVAQPPTSLSPSNTDARAYRQAYSCNGEGPFADCRLIVRPVQCLSLSAV